jgi:hypothetical protein
MDDSMGKHDPWLDISASHVNSFIDARLCKDPGVLQTSGRVLLPKSTVSIRSTLLGVIRDRDRRSEAEETLQSEGLGEVFRAFLEKDPWWVIRCDVADSMVSGRWGLMAFVLEGRGGILSSTGRRVHSGRRSTPYTCSLGASRR